MPSDRSVLERQIERVELRPFTLEGFHRRRGRKQRNRRIGSAVVVLALAAAGLAAFVRTFSSSTIPASDPRSVFLGTWEATDTDGSSLTMVMRATRDGTSEIVVRDDAAAVCSGAPSTMTGTGGFSGTDSVVIPTPVLICADGSEPVALSGPPLEDQLRDLTFVHDPETDTLADSFGVLWRRPGADGGEPPEGLAVPDEASDPSRFDGTWASTAADTGFLGTWESTDVDGSSLLLGVRVSQDPSGGVEVLLLDGAEPCFSSHGPITMTGIGRIEGRELAIDSQTWICQEPGEGEAGPQVVSGDPSLELAAAHGLAAQEVPAALRAPLVHDPETDTLVGPTGTPPDAPGWMRGRGLVWDRRPPGSDPIAVPFWGVWPQSSLAEAQEAQRRADAGDPASTWQLAPELATSPASESIPIPARDAADGAEFLTRFFRDVLGWEEYVTVARRSPGGDDPGWAFVRIRCGPGTNPLYPDDPNGGNCPPTIGDTHYETVSLMVTQPVRSGPSGIWVVADWAELAPSEEPASDLRYHEWVSRQYEQVAPPSEAELVEALEAFLSARVAGEGAETYLTEGYYQPRPRVPLLYATTEGRRYERFEIGRVEGPRWPAGVYAVTVRLFARGGEDVVEQEFAVWPGSRGQVTMDTWGRGGTTENGASVPDRFGSDS